MACKNHVDNSVNERRLRPIYDWLDYGNNKKALQEAEKVLKKQPGHQCARVLRALALLRLGKNDECQGIIDKVRTEIPCDDSTLQAMSICYRETHQPDKISALYEAAAKADPNNEELLTHLFMSYVRLGDFKKQQHTAMALYKLVPKNPYYFWAVMSIVMQAIKVEKDVAKRVILPLAERMVLKLVNEGKIEAEQEVQLYLMILELQEKHEEILKVFSGPLAPRISNLESGKATLLLKLKRYSEAVDAFKELISQNTDNWSYYKDYLTAALECQTVDSCLELLEGIEAKADDKCRAPQLARLELLRMAQAAKMECQIIPVDCMHKYFKQFGSKGCVVSDLKPYLYLLSAPDKELLLTKIEKDIEITQDGYPESVDQMERYIHLEQLKRLCGMHHSPMMNLEERKKLVQRLFELYKKGNELCPVEERLSTDLNPADTYVLLAAHLLHQLWCETGEAEHIYKAIYLLERSLTLSPSNFHVKILLVRMYLEVGFAGAADNVFVLLDVKSIQIDCLGFLHSTLQAPLGLYTHASHNFNYTTKFFISNTKDSADHVTFAYKYGSFLKIQEFIDLKERLEKSMHFISTNVDKFILELIYSDSNSTLLGLLTNVQTYLQENYIKWDTLRDNRNLEVVVGWEPIEHIEEDLTMREETRECLVILIKARDLLLRTLASVVESEKAELLGNLSRRLIDLVEQEIPSVLRKFKSEDGKDKLNSVIIPLDSVIRLREIHESKQLITVISLANSLSKFSYPDDDFLELLKESPSIRVPSLPECEQPITFLNLFLRLATCAETLSILTSICVATRLKSKPHSTQKRNKKKQNRECIDDCSETNQNWLRIETILMDRLQTMDAVLIKLEKINVEMGFTNNDDVAQNIQKYVYTSISSACKSLKTCVSCTIKHLKELS